MSVNDEGGLVPRLLPLPMAWWLYGGILLRQEQYLASQFGVTYDSYRSRVRRWL